MSAKVTRKHLFHVPEGLIYLDGNSLGPLPRSIKTRLDAVIDGEWGQLLIRAWNDAGWYEQPRRVGDRLARLIGAAAGSIVVGDTLSIQLYQALAAALSMRPGRGIVLSDSGNFPSDLYMAQGLIETLGRGHELRVLAPGEIAGAIDENTAAVMLTEVDYRSGRRHDMRDITRRAQAAGAVMIWDLAHSAGALPVDVTGANCEFAVGCTYKYLNGGPGAPAFIYVRPDIVEQAAPALRGWMGHAAPFAFEVGYRPAPDIERMRIGTPAVIQMSLLEEALKLWDDISMAQVHAASIELSQRFIAEIEARCPALELASPRDPARRGSQVSFRFEQGYAAMQALIARGVIGDFRAPDIMRFGIAPLYLDTDDVVQAAATLQQVLEQELWRNPAYQSTGVVT